MAARSGTGRNLRAQARCRRKRASSSELRRRAGAAPGDLPMLMAECEQIPAGRLACLIYTSGTGG